MKVQIEKRGDEIVFIGDCHNRPVAKAGQEGISVQSKHGSDKCPNVITWEQIEQAKSDYFARLKIQ